jgi:hypothetical protein
MLLEPAPQTPGRTLRPWPQLAIWFLLAAAAGVHVKQQHHQAVVVAVRAAFLKVL